MTVHGKTFVVTASFNNECLQLVNYLSQNIHGWVKNHENRESLPPRMFCYIRYTWPTYVDMYNKYMMYSYIVKHGFEKINDQVSDV